MTTDTVLRSDVDGVATLTLNRPEKLNALTPVVFVALRRHLDDLAADETVRAVVLTGAGRSFCAGHDLTAIAAGPYDPTHEAETVDALERLPVPVIAAIRGHCLTGGLELALGCDLLIAGESAKLADTHAAWGLVPVWGMSVRLPERVGIGAARRMMLTARRLDAAQAQAIGLVDEVVPDDDLEAAVHRLVAEITANSRGSLRIIKELLREARAYPRPDALARERSMPHGMPADAADRLSARAGS